MDKLKYIKLKNEDGSYTDSIPLAVDSDHVDINGNTLTNTLNTLATKTEVQAVASGSPAGVYATIAALTSADPDHSKIYVVTADGHWYYYNGSAWTDGGIYQSALNNNDMNLLKRNNNSTLKSLYEQINFNKNAFDGEYSHDFYSASTGEHTSTNQKYVSNVNIIDVVAESTLKYELPSISTNEMQGIYWIWYNNDSFISYSYKSGLNGSVNVPSSANKLRFEISYMNNIDIDDTVNIIIYTTNEEDSRTKFNKINNEILTLTNNINNLPKKFIGIKQNIIKETKCMNKSKTLVDLSSLGLESYHTVINVEEYTYYNIKASGSIWYPPFIFFDEDDNYLSDYYTISGDSRTGNISIDYNVIIPQNAVKMVINTFYNYIELFLLELKEVGLSVMPQQKYIAFGDSVCRGNHPDASKSIYAWPEMFGNIHNLITINQAHGGQGFLNTTYYNKTILQEINDMDLSDVNLVTISAGINDAGNGFTIGEITDTGTTSIMGMLYNCITTIMTKNPKIQIIVTGTTKQNGRYSTRLEEINIKMGLLCEQYGIAFVDMHNQPINQFNGITGGSLTSDGTHFNDDGYLLLSQFMCAKIGSLYGLE